MAQTPEGKVKRWLRERMKDRYPKAVHYCPPGGWFGQAGFPDDVWVILAGQFCVLVCVEAKAEGNGPSALQLKRLKDLKANGAICATMIGKDPIKLAALMTAIDTKIRQLEEFSGSISAAGSAGN